MPALKRIDGALKQRNVFPQFIGLLF